MFYARSGVFSSRDLYKDLVKSGHLQDSQDYDEIVKDSDFMTVLKDQLAQTLEKDPSKSLYGHGLISEYDLYWKCDTDLQLVQYFRAKNSTLSGDDMVMLREARKELKRLVTETRNNVVFHFGVAGTPLTKQQSKNLLTKTDEEIELEVKKRADKNLHAKNNQKKRRITDDESEQDAEEITDDTSDTNESTSEIVPLKYASSRWSKCSKGQPQDLFITQEITLTYLLPFLKTISKSTKFYDPCCGTCAIGDFLKRNGFNNVYETDLYTTDIKKDYLKDNFTDYDVMITNFPFCIKLKCFKKAFRSGNPFIVISSLDAMGRKNMGLLLHKYGVTVGCFAGSTSFINHRGKEISVGVCCWYFGNMDDAKPNEVRFKFFDDSFDALNINTNDSIVNEEEEEEDDDAITLSNLFK